MKRTLLITIKVDEREHHRFTAVAKSMGLPVSGMVRALVKEREAASTTKKETKK